MDRNFPCPNELAITLAELRARHRISNAAYGIYHQRLEAGEAQEVNVELYRTEQISSRQFNTIERAIERDRKLEAAAGETNPMSSSTADTVVTAPPERVAA